MINEVELNSMINSEHESSRIGTICWYVGGRVYLRRRKILL